MATSVLSFEGTCLLENSDKRARLSVNFKPPSHLSNRLCYAEVKIFQTHSKATRVDDPFLLRIEGWTQPQNIRVENGVQGSTSCVLAYELIGVEKGIPFLFFMPDGPHSIDFVINHLDPTEVVVSGTDKTFRAIVVLSVVPANSRVAPLS